jgi:hypothetical protein
MNCRRVFLGGLLAEAIITVLVLPLYAVYGPDAEVGFMAVPASFVGCFVAAIWAVRRGTCCFVMQGLAVGVFAVATYMALFYGAVLAGVDAEPQPLIYWVAHAFKLLGGMAGGIVASLARRPAAA